MKKNLKLIKENLLKALLNTIGQNKVCDSLAGINKAFDILEKEIIKLLKK